MFISSTENQWKQTILHVLTKRPVRSVPLIESLDISEEKFDLEKLANTGRNLPILHSRPPGLLLPAPSPPSCSGRLQLLTTAA